MTKVQEHVGMIGKNQLILNDIMEGMKYGEDHELLDYDAAVAIRGRLERHFRFTRISKK